MLPHIPSLDAYRLIYRHEPTWLPALRSICQRHHLDASSLRFAPPGSHVVFWVEQDWLIKLFCPLWRDDAAREALVLQALSNQPGLHVPAIRAQGELEGWPYLVLSRLPGQPLDTIWETLNNDEREEIASSLGTVMAALHQTPTAGLAPLLVDWQAFLAEQLTTFASRQARAGAAPEWMDACTAFLADNAPCLDPAFTPVLLNADLNPEHLFCERSSAGWRITGIIDFGDAMLGHPYYEFVAPGFIFHRAPALRRAMLLAYGLPPASLTACLSRTLLTYTLLHRFASLPDILSLCGEPAPTSLAELQQALWALE